MNKKLLVILVIATAILVTGAWVMAAKKPGVELKPAPTDVQGVQGPAKAPGLPGFANRENATPIPAPATIEKKSAIAETGTKVRGGVVVPKELLPEKPDMGLDVCDFWGEEAYYGPGWLWGNEYICNFQDPAFGYTYCPYTDVFPMEVTGIVWELYVGAAVEIDWQGFVYANIGTDCPYPGDVLCSTPVTHEVLDPGFYYLTADLTQPCCVYEPYFAGIYLATDVTEDTASHVWGTDGLLCQGYYQYDNAGWEDLVDIYGMAGMPFVNSYGYTRLQNDCEEQPICCQFTDHCESLTPTDCINAGGTPCPYNDARYQCIADVCMLPWMGDTCGITSVVPATVKVLAGGTANFTANVYFQGSQTSCFLTVTPDPACPSCVTTITPNPVVSPATSATISIATDPSTPVGTYTFDVNGAKVSATLEVVAPNDTCEVARYIAATGYYYPGWVEGDQNAIRLDPTTCVACGPDVYPFHIRQVKSRWVNAYGATSADVIFHIYEATTPYCNGPGAEIYQFPATITEWSPTYVTVNLPDIICVNGPFWLAAEYVSVEPPGVLPSLRFSNQTYDDTCSQFVYWASAGGWEEWADVWTPPTPGYLYLSAIGNCASGECPIECNMQQDNGSAAGYASFIMEGFQVAKYYNPEDYCEPPVYPYKISDVEFPLYKFTGADSIANIQIGIYLTCQDSCDGPGTLIYLSDVYHINSFYPNWSHIDLPEPVCVWEPFFVALKWGAGTILPSMLMDNNYGLPDDSCHQWYFYPGYSPPWIEHWDLWAHPEQVGVTMLRVSGATNHFECVQAPCDTAVDSLAYYNYPAYIWALPSTSGRNYPNERFDMPVDHGGRLERIRFAHYEMYGDPDPCYYVWLSDGNGHPADNNPPYQAIATFCIPTTSVQLYPNWTVIETYPQGIKFDPGEVFHVGYSFAFDDPGDTLKLLGDDLDVSTSDRAGIYWPTGEWKTMWEQYGYHMDWCIEAILCAIAPPESTFTVQCSPSHEYAVPGDPAAVKFHVNVGKVLNYVSPVHLSCTPPAGINVSFAPNDLAPPFTSDVTVSVDAGTPYGDYTLSFCGTGADGQGPTCCDVHLTVQPPYDDGLVEFYHGTQRMTNFGALGDYLTPADNFLCYGIQSLLFDATFIDATGPDNMALDFGRTHVHTGFIPPAHQTITYDPSWPANIGFAEFYTDTSIIPGEHDSLFVIGIMDSCVDFALKYRIYYNLGTAPITDMYTAVFEDWDFGDAYNNWGNLDFDHNLVWEYEPIDSSIMCGLFKAPFYDESMFNVQVVHNAYITWPNQGYGLDPDSVWRLLTTPGAQGATYVGPDSQDYSVMITAPLLTLGPGEEHIELWIDWCRKTDDGYSWSQWWHRVLRYAGFYRGDVNASDTLELPALDVSDLVYLMNYLFQGGAAPLPYADQGDVNADGKVDVLDAVYLINYVFKNGPAPIDCLRFIPSKWCRTSLFENPTWR